MTTTRTCQVPEALAARLHPHVRAEIETETAIAEQPQLLGLATAVLPLRPPQVKPVMDTSQEKKEAGKNSIQILKWTKTLVCSLPMR
jgi:hypothetical protein